MHALNTFPKPKILLLPIFGMGIFMFFYIIAATKYPGGSWALPNENGFSFWNNYLCDLLDDFAVNGEVNTARVLARAALGSICLSLILLWFYLPNLFLIKSSNLIVMWFSGLLALVTTLLLASGTHDVIVRIAGVFGVIALTTSCIEFYKAKFYKLLILGVICLIIFLINYIIYETNVYIRRLPMIQKITFSSFIFWFVCITRSLYQKARSFDKNKL